MKRIRKDIEISDLIYKSLRGETSKSEDELLEAWCLEPRNRKLFMELREADHLYEGVADMYNVDTKVPFKNVDDRIRKKKRVRLMKYVSGVAAVLLVGVVLWGLMEKEEKMPVRQVLLSSVSKGKMEPFATLVTTAGKVVYLEDSVKQESLKMGGNKETLKPQESERDVQSVPEQEVEYNVLTTSKQGNIKVVLYDGSLVWLNAGSELRYPNTFVENQRVVYLKGEAYFDVAKDHGHPFVVKTEEVEVKVLGTVFNVNAYPEGEWVRTTLVEGKVEAVCGGRLFVMEPGMQVAYSKGTGETEYKKVDTHLFTSWKDGYYEFEEMELGELMPLLGRWYAVGVDFEEPELKRLKFSGRLQRYETVADLVKMLEYTGDVVFEVKNDRILVRKR